MLTYTFPLSITLRMQKDNEPISLIVHDNPKNPEAVFSIFGQKFKGKEESLKVETIIHALYAVDENESLEDAHKRLFEKIKGNFSNSVTEVLEHEIFANSKNIKDFIAVDNANLAAKILIGRIAKEVIKNVAEFPNEKNKAVLREFVDAGAIIDPTIIKAAERGEIIKTKLEMRIERAKGIGHIYTQKFKETSERLIEKSDFILGDAHTQFKRLFTFPQPITSEQLVSRFAQNKSVIKELISNGMSLTNKIDATESIRQFNLSAGIAEASMTAK